MRISVRIQYNYENNYKKATMGRKGEIFRNEIILSINEYKNEHGFVPTIREIADLVGLKSTASVHRHLGVLKKRKSIDWDASKPRTLRVL